MQRYGERKNGSAEELKNKVKEAMKHGSTYKWRHGGTEELMHVGIEARRHGQNVERGSRGTGEQGNGRKETDTERQRGTEPRSHGAT